MRLLVLVAASLVPASSAAVQPPPREITAAELRKIPFAEDAKVTLPGQRCPDDPRLRLAEELTKLKLRNLGELPPGDLQLAVLRNVDGCVEPVIVRYGYGGEPSPQSPNPALHR